MNNDDERVFNCLVVFGQEQVVFEAVSKKMGQPVKAFAAPCLRQNLFKVIRYSKLLTYSDWPAPKASSFYYSSWFFELRFKSLRVTALLVIRCQMTWQQNLRPELIHFWNVSLTQWFCQRFDWAGQREDPCLRILQETP